MRRGLALLLLLAACGGTAPAPESAPVSAARVGVTLIPDAAGLGIEGSAKRIDFGRSPRGLVPVLTRELGTPRALGLAGCPSGVVQQLAWGDLILSFTPERFVGWRSESARAGAVCT